MVNVQNVFDSKSVKEFEQLITLCGWKIKKQDNLSIICWQQGAQTNIRPSVKGLIYDVDGNIMAPGVPMPLEAEPASKPIGYTRALDGVTFRFWYSPTLGRFTWSTNGMITAGTWLCSDLNSIMIDCISEAKLVDLDALNPEYCYTAILESPQIPNIYYVEKPILTLIRIFNKECIEIPLSQATGFKSVISFYEQSQLAEMKCCNRDIVVTRDSFGEMAHYSNGDTYRVLTDNANAAEHFRPNYSEVWQHWIYHARNTTPDMWEYGAIAWYKLFFPWNAKIIDGLCNYFTETVPPPEYEEILQSTTCMKRIVDNYLAVTASA